ncbi:hypothetical protein JW960_05865 [candidate division KSB1 bacterium]|nr:hypothetical protein [candidate division KSB1 bacterium]
MEKLLKKICHFQGDEDGQLIAFTAIIGIVLVMFVSIIYNIGVYVGEKMKVQDAADAAAYSHAVWEARTYNYYAYMNRTMLSYMVATAFIGAIQSERNKWQAVASVTGGVPILGAITSAFSTLYNVVANVTSPVRNVTWLLANAAYLDQWGAYGEMTLQTFSNSGIMSQVAQQIDGSLRVNRGGAGTLAMLATWINYSQLIDFNGGSTNTNILRTLYYKSRDGYTAGWSFPREFTAQSPIQIGPLFRMGMQGVNELRMNSNVIHQREEPWAQLGVGASVLGFTIGTWFPRLSIPAFLPDNYSPPISLTSMRFFNYRMPNNADDRFPSVYAVVNKQGSNIPQINFFGVRPDINAVARAQVFYWDPNRSRSQQLRNFNPDREPNFFNPFWRARLARMDNTGRFIAGMVDLNAFLLSRH